MTTHTIWLREEWFAAAAASAADCISLGAAPAFAVMALVAGVVGGDSPDMSCSAMQNASSLSGMLPVYVLMSAFHFGPWFKLIGSPRIWGRKS
jgi:hypothetical protein